MRTNDRVSAAIVYSNPVANVANPGGSSFTLNSDGTYSFIATNPGTYRYVYDVCTPASPTPSCVQEIIVIRAIDHEINTNLPVANNDFATRLVYPGSGPTINTAIDVLANDNTGNIGVALVPGTLAVTPTSSRGGTVTIVGGLVNYFPATSFTGIDTFTYTIEDANGNTTSATVFVRVFLNTGDNFVVATDDYRNIVQGTTAAGGALANDQQVVTITPLSVVGGPTTLTDASGNTLNILANGNYTFTPNATFNGNTSFIYTTTGTGGVTASATIHFTVAPFDVFPDFGSVLVNNTINGNIKTNDDVLFGTTYGTYVLSSGPGGVTTFTGNADGTYSFITDTPGTYVYTYLVCSPTTPNPPCKPSSLTITVSDPLSTTNPPIANPDIGATFANANPALPGVPVTINAVSNDQPGNPSNVIVPSTATLVGTPAGVANNGDGTFTYTPAASFTGTFTFQYTVQDNATTISSPTTVTITVFPAGSQNAISVTDDFLTTQSGSPIVRSAANGLLSNDSQLITTAVLTATAGTFTNAGQGTLVLATNGSYTFTPVAGFAGTTQFPYTVTGTNGAIASGTAFFTVSPRITPDVNVGFIDVSIPGNLNTNDLVETGTTYGNIDDVVGNPNTNVPVLNANGTYTFITNLPGVYNFTYEVCAPSQTSPNCYTSTLSITVTDPGITTNPPIANDDVATTTANADLALAGVPVTINAVVNDQAGNPNNVVVPSSATLIGTPAVVNNNDGTFTYTPPASFFGTFTFQYTVTDDATVPNTSAPATVTVTVFPASSPNILIAADDYYSGLSTATISTGNILDNDTQLFGGAVTTLTTPGTFTSIGGELTLNADGTFVFVPNPTFQGTTSFTYTAQGTDGALASATIFFTIYRGLITNEDVGVAFTDKTIGGSAATNDNVPVGSTYTTATTLPNAILTLNADGTYTFVATAVGVYTYNIEVCAPTTPPGCATRPLTITVTDPAILTNPPVANTDLAITYAAANPVTTAGQLVVINVVENDKAGNIGGSLVPGSVIKVGGPLAGLVNNGDGTFNYTPPIGQGPGEVSFQYSVNDGINTATATVFIKIFSAATPNVVTPADDFYSGSVGANITGDVLINDTQLDGTTALAVNNPGTFANATGSLVLNANGSFAFTPVPTFSGTSIFTYQAIGTDGATGTATLHLTVNGGLNSNPDVNVTLLNVSISGSVATNDNVPTGSNYSNTTGALANATLTFNANGTYTFAATVVGVYTYNIQVCAPTAPTPPCETKTLTITVINPAILTNPPIANTDVASTVANANPALTGVPVTINVIANDLPGNVGGTINAGSTSVTVGPTNGSIVNNGNGTITYTPAAGFTGTDTFTYTVSDAAGNGPSTAIVTVTVFPAGTPNIVTASDDYASSTQGIPSSGSVLTNDSQLSAGALTAVAQTTTIPEGTLALIANGTYTFTPLAAFTGGVNFPYVAVGAGGATANATLYITVTPPLLNTWSGTTDTDWCTPGNWSLGIVPVAGMNITIESSANPPTISGSCNVCINNLTIDSGASLTIPGGQSVCVTGTLNSQGTVLNAGNIVMRGTVPQVIIGDFNISNLDIDNPTGVTITTGAGNLVNITESIKLTQGTLTTNNNIRLISDASGDAYFAPLSPAECLVVNIVGNVRFQKFVDGGNRAFRFIAHPFDGTLSLQQVRDFVHITGDGLDFNDTGNPSAFWYNTVSGNQAGQDEDTGWVPVTSVTLGDWTKGRAVRMMFRGPRSQGGVVGDDNYNPLDVTYELIGAVNLCDQSLLGLRRFGNPGDLSGAAGNSAFNFIGNPFPAAINLKTIPGGSRTDVGANYYVWQPRVGIQSGSTVFNSGSGRGGNYVTEPFTGGTPVLGQLASGTGFFVVADVDNASITFTEANKLSQNQLTTGEAVMFREDDEFTSRYGANSLQLAIDINGEQIDRVLVYFDEETDAKVDIMDATKFENPLINFFTVSEDDYAMAIDRRPWVDGEEYRIPLHILSPAVNYTLTVPDFDLKAGRVVQLYDRHLDKTITLEKGATYAFEVTAEQASKGHRFDIVMGIEVITSIGRNDSRFQAFLLPNPAQQQVMVNVQRPDEIADTHVRLLDVRGEMLYETTISATDDAQISYEVGSLAKVVYLVEITHGKQRIVKRLMVN